MGRPVSSGSCLCVSGRWCGRAPKSGGLRARWRTTHKVREVGSPPSSQNAKGRRLLGVHSCHLRGLIKAPHWWWEWAPGGRLPLAVLSAFWAPNPAARGGRSRPPAGGGNGGIKGAFPLCFGSLADFPPPPTLCVVLHLAHRPPLFGACPQHLPEAQRQEPDDTGRPTCHTLV